jgi:hypothetical protein
MRGNAITIDTETSAGSHHDEPVVLKFTEPTLHGSFRPSAKIGGSIAIGPVNLSVIQVVYSEIAAQNDVETSRTERRCPPGWVGMRRADDGDERGKFALVFLRAHAKI